jgi:hypothetical protein
VTCLGRPTSGVVGVGKSVGAYLAPSHYYTRSHSASDDGVRPEVKALQVRTAFHSVVEGEERDEFWKGRGGMRMTVLVRVYDNN